MDTRPLVFVYPVRVVQEPSLDKHPLLVPFVLVVARALVLLGCGLLGLALVPTNLINDGRLRYGVRPAIGTRHQGRSTVESGTGLGSCRLVVQALDFLLDRALVLVMHYVS